MSVGIGQGVRLVVDSVWVFLAGFARQKSMNIIKRISILFLMFILFFPSVSFAVVSLNTINSLDSVVTGQTGSLEFGKVAGTSMLGWSYSPGASHDICTVSVVIGKQSSPVDSVQMYFAFASTTSGSGSSFSSIGQNVRSANSSWQITTSPGEYVYTFTPCYTVVGANKYVVWLERTGSTSDVNYYIGYYGTGSQVYTGTGSKIQCRYVNGVQSCGPANDLISDIVFNGVENFSAFSPNNNASTTGQITAECANGSSIAYVLCYLFIPSQSVLDQFGTLDNHLIAQAPFSYIDDGDLLLDELFGASTSTPPAVVIRFPTGVGTTSDLTLIDIATVRDIPAVQAFRTASGSLLYIVWAFWVVKAISKII